MRNIHKTQNGSWTTIQTMIAPHRHEFQSERDRQISELNDIIHYIDSMEIKSGRRGDDKFFLKGVKTLFNSVMDAYEWRITKK